jgi:hypothetical protein
LVAAIEQLGDVAGKWGLDSRLLNYGLLEVILNYMMNIGILCMMYFELIIM